MSISIINNYELNASIFLDSRRSIASLNDLKRISQAQDILYPHGFEVFCVQEGSYYVNISPQGEVPEWKLRLINDEEPSFVSTYSSQKISELLQKASEDDTNIGINDNEPSPVRVYSSQKVEGIFAELRQETTRVDDDLLDIDTRVNYLEGEMWKIYGFDGSYDSLTNKPTLFEDNRKYLLITNDEPLIINKSDITDSTDTISISNLTGVYGNLVANDDGTFTYTLSKFLNDIEEFEFMVGDNTQKVVIVPYKEMLYDDNFIGITYSGLSTWEIVEDEKCYKGSVHYTEGVKGSPGSIVIKDMKGTGYELLATTNKQATNSTVKLYNSNSTLLKSIPINMMTEETYYMTPCFSVIDCEYDLHRIVVSVGAVTYSDGTVKNGIIYLDGIRIYNPLGEITNQSVLNLYNNYENAHEINRVLYTDRTNVKFNPTLPYHPATKEYVDSCVNEALDGIGSGNVGSDVDLTDLVVTNSISMGRKEDTTIGARSVALGSDVEASGNYSYAEGYCTTASKSYSHAEGYRTEVSGMSSHAEGHETEVSGDYSHAEGGYTTASGFASHAEGYETTASNECSHAEGDTTTASGFASHAEGIRTIASSEYQHVQGKYNIEDTANAYAHIVGNGTADNNRSNAHTLDWDGNAWYKGNVTVDGTPTADNDLVTKKYVDEAVGNISVGSDIDTNDLVITNSISMGRREGTKIGERSFAVGNDVEASEDYSHAEGDNTTASGYDSHAEGYGTTASGNDSHAEGCYTMASGDYSHSEGSETTASGWASHAEGCDTMASGMDSHAEGWGTMASSENQHVQGRFNIEDSTNTYAHIVGNGTDDDAKSNAHTLDWDGNAWFAGNVTIGTDNKKLATEEYVNGQMLTTIISKTDTLITSEISTFAVNNGILYIYENIDGLLDYDRIFTPKITVNFTNSNDEAVEMNFNFGLKDDTNVLGPTVQVFSDDDEYYMTLYFDNFTNINDFNNQVAFSLKDWNDDSYTINNIEWKDYIELKDTFATKEYVDDNSITVEKLESAIEYACTSVQGQLTSLDIGISTGTNLLQVPIIEVFPEVVNNINGTLKRCYSSLTVTGVTTSIAERYDVIFLTIYDANDKMIARRYMKPSSLTSLIFAEDRSYTNGNRIFLKFDFDKEYNESGTLVDSVGKIATKLEIKSNQNNEEYINEIKDFKISVACRTTTFLSTDNDRIYTPTDDYHPATKKYVDEAVGNIGTGSDIDTNDLVVTNSISMGRKEGTTIGTKSVALGINTTASGKYSHAEGYYTKAIGESSHAEGSTTTASGGDSHAEGTDTTASGFYSHAEGLKTTASSFASHAEGSNTTASGDYSHAEGYSTIASKSCSHAEGYDTEASGIYSHAEGEYTTASKNCSHAEGYHTTADGHSSHAEGNYTTASGHSSHAEGYETQAKSDYQHVQGKYNIEDTTGTYAHIVGNGTDDDAKSNAHTLDWDGNAWYAGDVYVGGTSQDTDSKKLATESYVNEAISSIDTGSDIDTDNLVVTNSISMGRREGTTIGTKSFAVGNNVEASGLYSHAEGYGTTASGDYSHAEVGYTTASGFASHAEGYETKASGDYSHTEGDTTIASGNASHAEGIRTIASSENQHVQGKYNIEDTTNTYAHIVGNGSSSARSNAHTLDWDGNAWFAGSVKIGADNKELATKEYVDEAVANNGGGNDSKIAEIDTSSWTELFEICRGLEDGAICYFKSYGLHFTYDTNATIVVRGYYILTKSVYYVLQGITSDFQINLSSSGFVNASKVSLDRNNKYTYIPTNDYNPATKKYVDDTKDFLYTEISECQSNFRYTTLNIGTITLNEFFGEADVGNTESAGRIYYNLDKDISVYNTGSRVDITLLDTDDKIISYSIANTKHDVNMNPILQNVTLPSGTVFTAQVMLRKNIQYDESFNQVEAEGKCCLMITFPKASNTEAITTEFKTLKLKLSLYRYNFLTLTNKNEFVPAEDYHPATKKYVDEAVANLSELKINIVNGLTFANAYINYNNGDYVSGGSAYACQEYIPVISGATYEVSGVSNIVRIAYYDSSKTYMNQYIDNTPTFSLTPPSNASYIRVHVDSNSNAWQNLSIESEIENYIRAYINNSTSDGSEGVDLSSYALKTDLHSHSNKTVIDTITSDMTTKWNQSIPFNDTYVSDCNAWLTNGYVKTGAGQTSNLPSACTGSDRWGILFFIAENVAQGTGTQMYFPIDGTYKGRIFTRSLTNMNQSPNVGEWNLLSTFSGNYNDLTNKPTIPSIEGLATEEYVDNAIDNIPEGFSGNYNDLTNKPTIPSIEGLATEGYVNNMLGGLRLVQMTQSEYDALESKDSNTLYIII